MVEKLDNVNDKWFRAKISKKDLKLLSKKSDLKGLQHVTLYFILLFFFGYMSIATWGTWWTVLWLWLYGVLSMQVTLYGTNVVIEQLSNQNI